MDDEKATLKKIETLRHKLVKFAHCKGLTNEETVEISQQLDHCLNDYSKIKRHEK